MKKVYLLLIILVTCYCNTFSQILVKEVLLPETTTSSFFSSILKLENSIYISSMNNKLVQVDENTQEVETYYGFYRYNSDNSFDTLTLKKRENYYFPYSLHQTTGNEFEVYCLGHSEFSTKWVTLSRMNSLGEEISFKEYKGLELPLNTASKEILQDNDSLYIVFYRSKMLSLMIIDKELNSHRIVKLLDIPLDEFNEASGFLIKKIADGYAIIGVIAKGFKQKLLVLITDNHFNIIKQNNYENSKETYYLYSIAQYDSKLYCLFRSIQYPGSETPDKYNYVRVYNENGDFIEDIIFLGKIPLNSGIIKIDAKGNIFLSYYVYQKGIKDGSGEIGYIIWDFGVTKIDAITKESRSLRWGMRDVDNIIGNFLILDENNIIVCGHQEYNGYLGFIDFSAESVSNELNIHNNWISPNPASDFITVALKPSEGFEPSEGCAIKIFNTLGEMVLSASARHAVPLQINISALPKGIYFVKVGGEIAKFIKF